MKLIELTDIEGRTFYINPKHIVTVNAAPERHDDDTMKPTTHIATEQHSYLVWGSPADIIKQLTKGQEAPASNEPQCEDGVGSSVDEQHTFNLLLWHVVEAYHQLVERPEDKKEDHEPTGKGGKYGFFTTLQCVLEAHEQLHKEAVAVADNLAERLRQHEDWLLNTTVSADYRESSEHRLTRKALCDYEKMSKRAEEILREGGS